MQYLFVFTHIYGLINGGIVVLADDAAVAKTLAAQACIRFDAASDTLDLSQIEDMLTLQEQWVVKPNQPFAVFVTGEMAQS